MSNLFKFQGEKTDADNTGAKEKVAAKKKIKGCEPWNIHSINKTDRLFSAALAGTLPLLGARRMEENQWLEVSPNWSCTIRQKGTSTDAKAAPSKALLVLLLQLGCIGDSQDLPWDCWDSEWWRGKVALVSPWHSLPEASTAAPRLLFSCIWCVIVMLSIFELIFDAERIHLLPANGNISFIVMLFPVFKLMLLRELKGNPVHLVSGIEQTERPQHC